MKLALPAAAAALVLVAAPLGAARAAEIEAVRPWSRPAAVGGTGAGYVTLVNHGKSADALVGAASPDAAKVEMHAARMAGGVMKMTPEAQTPIPANGQVSFAPGGRHLMLVGLKRPLKIGDKVPATLKFASGATLKVDFVVQAQAPAASGHMRGTDHMPGMPGM
ncbi:MAG TPA: copper chaperone PCu(A)C [Phenylobacterium sp.]|uniref:copper chaperone PCu(A)C n=1 Tax=Phenylobacterium sp. TaxID=1871053 RepID=UPI002B465233|nr:copper chaperone PCu(A)C [Phenylobacterium sp.]HKR86785.1 copper chaperone PCu(A)C [Phenylobacterium sp.]